MASSSGYTDIEDCEHLIDISQYMAVEWKYTIYQNKEKYPHNFLTAERIEQK